MGNNLEHFHVSCLVLQVSSQQFRNFRTTEIVLYPKLKTENSLTDFRFHTEETKWIFLMNFLSVAKFCRFRKKVRYHWVLKGLWTHLIKVSFVSAALLFKILYTFLRHFDQGLNLIAICLRMLFCCCYWGCENIWSIYDTDDVYLAIFWYIINKLILTNRGQV